MGGLAPTVFLRPTGGGTPVSSGWLLALLVRWQYALVWGGWLHRSRQESRFECERRGFGAIGKGVFRLDSARLK